MRFPLFYLINLLCYVNSCHILLLMLKVLEINKVKRYENGFILEPVVLSPDCEISELDALRSVRKISGVPVTADGKMGSKLVGLISNRDTDFLEDRTRRISELMTPIESLVVGKYPISIEDANSILMVRSYMYRVV